MPQASVKLRWCSALDFSSVSKCRNGRDIGDSTLRVTQILCESLHKLKWSRVMRYTKLYFCISPSFTEGAKNVAQFDGGFTSTLHKLLHSGWYPKFDKYPTHKLVCMGWTPSLIHTIHELLDVLRQRCSQFLSVRPPCRKTTPRGPTTDVSVYFLSDILWMVQQGKRLDNKQINTTYPVL